MGSIMNYMPLMGQGLSSGSSIIGSVLTNRANKKMADVEWQRNKEMWRMQNQYNSPSMQMARFKEAGLNPNLIYGQGTAGNASSIPQYHAPRQEYNLGQLNLGESLGQYMDFKMKGAQVDNITEQNKSIKLQNSINALKLAIMAKFGMKKEEWNTNKAFYDYAQSEWDSTMKALNFSFASDTYDTRKETLYNNMVKSGSGAQLTDQQYQNALLDNSIKQLIFKQKTKDVEFLENGGKYFNPLLMFLRIFSTFGK